MTEKAVSRRVVERASRIKLILMDVDGVLTEGRLYYYAGPDREMFETKGFNSHDGLGLHFCHMVGIKTGVISGRDSPAVNERARILKMSYVYQGLLDKAGAFEEILSQAGLADDEAAFIGDDFTDCPLIKRCGLGVAVANARPEVRQVADYVTALPGGQGAVREVVELVLRSRGLWESILAKYELI